MRGAGLGGRAGALPGLLAVAATLATGCLDPDRIGAPERRGIIGGRIDLGDPAVVALRTCRSDLAGCGICTGTLIAPRVVLTASHCIDDNVALGEVDRLEVFFGTTVGEEGTTIGVDAARMHRYYDPDTLDHDIAVVHLAADAPAGVEPVALRSEPATAELVGATIRMVGFGETAFGAGDTGVKRQVESIVTDVAARHLFTGTEEANTCKGDSGGPIFLGEGAAEEQIGVTSRSRSCSPNSVKMRVDPFLDELVWPFVDAHDGPCALDGACESECPRTPDPDCDPCGFDGTCAAGCPSVDWDCPLAGLLGAGCADADDCESRLCLEATDDPRVRYCSAPCDPSRAGDCLSGMVCEDGAAPRCVWPEPTPGALGAACGLDGDCRSGICEDGLCVEPCDQVAGGVCPAPLVCRPGATVEEDVCGPELTGDGGCGCRAGGQGSRGGALVLALAVAAALRRRR